MPDDDVNWQALPCFMTELDDECRWLHLVPNGFQHSICGVPLHTLSMGDNSGFVCPFCEPSQEVH